MEKEVGKAENLKPKFKGKTFVFCLVLAVCAIILGWGISDISTEHEINKITGDFAKTIEVKDKQLKEISSGYEEKSEIEVKQTEGILKANKKIEQLKAENERLSSINSDLKYNNQVYRDTIAELSSKIGILRTSSHSSGSSYIPVFPSGY